MDVKYGKLISRTHDGNLMAVYPEILCDGEIDWENRSSTKPVENRAIADAIEEAERRSDEKLKDAFSASGGGLGWNDNIKKGYVDFSQMPQSDIKNVVNSMVDENGAIVADPDTGKLTVDFTKLTPEQIMALCSTTGGIIASKEEGENHGKLAIDFSKMPSSQIEGIVNSMVDPNGAIVASNAGLLTVDFSKLTPEQIMKLCSTTGGIISSKEEGENYGKLAIDFSKMPSDQIKNVVNSMVLVGGGIAADDETGKLKIDFSKIDPVTKRSITSALKMQTPLEANLTIYVDNVIGDDNYKDYDGVLLPNKGTKASGLIPHPITGDTTWNFTDSRGRPVTMQYGYPFKSMGAAVTYVSENFSLGSKSVYIRVISNVMNLPNGSTIAIPYYGSVTLPALNRTSGTVNIFSHSTTNRVTLMNVGSGGVFGASGSGANYKVQLFDIKSLPYSTDSTYNQYVGASSAVSHATLSVEGCHYIVSYVGNKHAKHFSLRPFSSSSNGSVGFNLLTGSYNSIEYDRGKDPANLSDNVYPMFMQNTGKMTANSAYENETLELQIPLDNGDALHLDEWPVTASTSLDETAFDKYVNGVTFKRTKIGYENNDETKPIYTYSDPIENTNGITDLYSKTIHIPVYNLLTEFNSLAETNGLASLPTEAGYGVLQGSESAIKSAIASLKGLNIDSSISLDEILAKAGANRVVSIAFKSTLDSLTEFKDKAKETDPDVPFVGNKAYTKKFGNMDWLKAHVERVKFYMDRNSWLPAFRRVDIVPHMDGSYSCSNDMAILRGTPEDLKAFIAVMALDAKRETDSTSIDLYLSTAELIYNEALAEYEAMWKAEHGGTVPVQVKILLDERALIDELLERRNNKDSRQYAYIDRFVFTNEGSENLQANRAQMIQQLQDPVLDINPENEVILRGKKTLLIEFLQELCSQYASIAEDYRPSEINLLNDVLSASVEPTPALKDVVNFEDEEHPIAFDENDISEPIPNIEPKTLLDTTEAQNILLNNVQKTKIVRGKITDLTALRGALLASSQYGSSIWPYVHCDSLYGFQCNGTTNVEFLHVTTGSSYYYGAGSSYDQYFVVPPRKSAIGKKFNISGVSTISCGIRGAFPGDKQGSVDSYSYASIPGWSAPIAFSPSIGTIMWFNLAGGSRSKIISGWLLANGGQYKQTDYPDLYAVIGDAYADAASTPPNAGYFRVPNLTAELPSGAVPYIKAKN